MLLIVKIKYWHTLGMEKTVNEIKNQKTHTVKGGNSQYLGKVWNSALCKKCVHTYLNILIKKIKTSLLQENPKIRQMQLVKAGFFLKYMTYYIH